MRRYASDPRSYACPRLGLFALAALALAGLVFVYFPALRGELVFDDRYLPFLNDEVVGQPLSGWLKGVRPLVTLTYWFNYQTSGLDPGGYHVLNLLLHFVSGILVYPIVRRLLTLNAEDGSKADVLAAFAAGLFLFHPIQSEAVVYVAARSESLCVLFGYAAYLLFLGRVGDMISWSRSIGILVLCAAAMLAKEHAVMLPLLFLLTDAYWSGRPPSAWLRLHGRLYTLLALGAAAGGVMIVSVLRTSHSAGFNLTGVSSFEYLITQFRSIWVYLRLFLWPVGQNVDHAFPLSHGLLDGASFGGFLGLVALVAAAIAWRRRFALASFGLFVFLLLIAPTSSFMPFLDALVERRTYFPFLGLLLIVLDLLRRWRVPRSILLTTLGAALLGSAAVCRARVSVWGSAIDLWQDAAAKAPWNPRAQFQLAQAFYEAGDCARSAQSYARVASLTPDDASLQVNWALALDCLGDPDSAQAKLQAAIRLLPAEPAEEKDAVLRSHVFTQLGFLNGKYGRNAEARVALEEALRLQPWNSLAHSYLGHLAFAEGDLSSALESYQKALALNPNNVFAQEGVARTQSALASRPDPGAP